MLWRNIRGWSISDVEPPLSLVSVTTLQQYFIAMIVDPFFLIPFPYSAAPPSMTVGVAICTLPKLTTGWDKNPLGDQLVTDLATLLESGNEWQCRFHSVSLT